jgi:hypothetical protein
MNNMEEIIQMNNIYESLRIADFKTVLKPDITIGEYESNIDTTAVIISLKFSQQSALKDYDSFIQRSEIKILQTKKMEFPSQDGNYYFYITLYNDNKLAEYIESIFQDLSALSDINYFNCSINGTKYNKTSIINIKSIIETEFNI